MGLTARTTRRIIDIFIRPFLPPSSSLFIIIIIIIKTLFGLLIYLCLLASELCYLVQLFFLLLLVFVFISPAWTQDHSLPLSLSIALSVEWISALECRAIWTLDKKPWTRFSLPPSLCSIPGSEEDLLGYL